MFEAAVRGGAVALLVLLTVIGLRDKPRLPAAWYGALLALGGAAYCVISAPIPALRHGSWRLPLDLLSLAAPAAFWLWAEAHFDDDFRPSWRAHAVYPALLVLGAVALTVDRRWLWHIRDLIVLILVGAGAFRIAAGFGGDLVAGRRRLRIALPLVVGAYIVATTASESVAAGAVLRLPGSTINALGIAALSFAFALIRLSGGEPAAAAGAPADALVRDAVDATAAPLDTADRAALAALRRLMEEDRTYREAGLSIGALAARLGLAEYRLRRLINQHIGQRNFSSYVNGYRLAEAKAALADPDQAAVPILTIALDAGFQSLGPFNRAFKSDTGMTPSEFRRAALRTPGPDAPDAPAEVRPIAKPADIERRA